MDDSTPWVEILDSLYESGGYAEVRFGPGGAITKSSLPIFERIDGEIAEDLVLLLKIELIETVKTDDDIDRMFVYLTEKGFDVAHERELRSTQQQNSKDIAFFTLILGFAAIVQGIAAAIQIQPVTAKLGLLLILLLLAITIALYSSDVGNRALDAVARLRGVETT